MIYDNPGNPLCNWMVGANKEAKKHIFFKHLLDPMRLIYAVFIILLILTTSAQCVLELNPKDAAATEARMPKIGDQVQVIVGANPEQGFYAFYNGKITDIGNGFLCLNALYGFDGKNQIINEPTDVCIGIGSIIGLFWKPLL